MAKCKVIGLPKKALGGDTSPKSTLQADPRSKSVIEAEKGETIFTNTGLDNISEHFVIGGKKHGQGGTPLNVPKDSFVFSDRLKVEDKNILSMFGETTKKTIAEIAKKYKLNEYKAVLKNPDADKLSKRTAELNMENGVSKLSQLSLFQESLKGMPQGMSKMFEPFIEKTKLRPEDMFPVKEVETITTGIKKPMMAFGGQIPVFAGGGDWGKLETEDAKKAKAQYDYIVSLGENNEKGRAFKKALWEEYLLAKDDSTNYSSGINKKGDKSKLQFKDENELFEAYKEMQERNLIFKAQGKDVASTPHAKNKNKEIVTWAKEFKVPIPTSYDAIAKQQLAYRVFNNLVDKKEKYKLEELRPFTADKRGASDDGPNKNQNMSLVDADYTNTTAGQISGFDLSKLNPVTTNQPNINVDTTKVNPATNKKWTEEDINRIKARPFEAETPYWTTDLNSLNRAIGSKLAINKYPPFNPAANINLTDAAYYSPERAIAATNEQVASGVKGSTTFSGPQQQGANFSQMQGQAFGQVANLISDYADKNVGIFNNVNQVNTQIANSKAKEDQQLSMKNNAETATMSQAYDNAIQMAKDKIVQMTNNAITNRGETQALNTLTEQYKVDPRTGFTYFTGVGKPLSTANPNEKDIADEVNAIMSKVPGITAETAAKMVIGRNSGKWVVEQDDRLTQPNEIK